MSNKANSGKQKRTLARKATMPGRTSPLAFAANLAFVPDTHKGDVALTTFDRKGRALGSFAMSAEAALELFDQLGEAIALITGSRGHIGGHRAKKLDAEFKITFVWKNLGGSGIAWHCHNHAPKTSAWYNAGDHPGYGHVFENSGTVHRKSSKLPTEAARRAWCEVEMTKILKACAP